MPEPLPPTSTLPSAAAIEPLLAEIRILRQEIYDLKRCNAALEIHLAKAMEPSPSEAIYRNFFENALDGMFQVTPSGELQCLNAALAQCYGYASAAAMRATVSHVQDLYPHPDDWARLQHRLQREPIIKGVEYSMSRPDGQPIWLSHHLYAVYNAHNHLLYYMGIVENISKERDREKALKRRVKALSIEIDQVKRSQRVSEIVETEEFQELQEKVHRIRRLRKRLNERPQE